MIASSTTAFATAAASLLLAPALAIGSLLPDSDIIRVHELRPDEAVQWPSAQDNSATAAFMGHQMSHETNDDDAEGSPQTTAHDQILTHRPQGDNDYSTGESTPLDGGPELQPELKRSVDGDEGTGAVLLSRETSAAPTIYGVSIWLILAWLALMYLMYKTGSMF